MERKKEDKNKVWFVKIGGGSCRIKGRIIKPKEKIHVDPEWIPKSFRTFFKPIGKDAAKLNEEVKKPIPGNKDEYEIQERKTKGLFDVINLVTEKVLNEKGLTEKEATLLKDAINS